MRNILTDGFASATALLFGARQKGRYARRGKRGRFRGKRVVLSYSGGVADVEVCQPEEALKDLDVEGAYKGTTQYF